MSAYTLKECSDCGLYKQTTEFYKGKKKVDGTRSIRGDCKACYLKKSYTPNTPDVVSSSVPSIETLLPTRSPNNPTLVRPVSPEIKEPTPSLQIDPNSEPIKTAVGVNESVLSSSPPNSPSDSRRTAPPGGLVKELRLETTTVGILQSTITEVSHPRPRKKGTSTGLAQIAPLLKQIESQNEQLSQLQGTVQNLQGTVQELKTLAIQDRETVQGLQDSATQDRATINSLQVALETERKEVATLKDKTQQDTDLLAHRISATDTNLTVVTTGMNGLATKYRGFEQHNKIQAQAIHEQKIKIEKLMFTVTEALSGIERIQVRDTQEAKSISKHILDLRREVSETARHLKDLACQVSSSSPADRSDHKQEFEYKGESSVVNLKMAESLRICSERISHYESMLLQQQAEIQNLTETVTQCTLAILNVNPSPPETSSRQLYVLHSIGLFRFYYSPYVPSPENNPHSLFVMVPGIFGRPAMERWK